MSRKRLFPLQHRALLLPVPAAGRIDAYRAGRDDAAGAVGGHREHIRARCRVLFATGTGARMYRGRGPLPAVPPRPRRWLPAALAAGLSPHSMRQACLRTLNLAPGPACATCRTPWDTPPPRTTRRYDRSRGNLDRSPAICSPGTSAAPAEQPCRAEPFCATAGWWCPPRRPRSGADCRSWLPRASAPRPTMLSRDARPTALPGGSHTR